MNPLMTRLMIAAAAVFVLATLCSAQEHVKATNLGDGTNNTDVNLYVYDQAGKQVGKDDSPGPKSSVKLTPDKDGKYKFVITNSGGENTVAFKVTVAQ